MIIRNQRRNRLFYFGEGDFIEIGYPPSNDINQTYTIQAASEVYDEWIILGSYKTESTALKVLQEIYLAFGDKDYYSMPTEEESR